MIRLPTYTGHKETESTTKTETHGTRNDCLDRARLHTTLHLYFIRIGQNPRHNRRRTILTIACSCSFIPWVSGLPPREVIGIAVPVVPGNAMLIVDVGKVWIEYGRISYSLDRIQAGLKDQSTGPRRESVSK